MRSLSLKPLSEATEGIRTVAVETLANAAADGVSNLINSWRREGRWLL